MGQLAPRYTEVAAIATRAVQTENLAVVIGLQSTVGGCTS
jgi:hypothetical protein